jgi:hypothetical protein
VKIHEVEAGVTHPHENSPIFREGDCVVLGLNSPLK